MYARPVKKSFIVYCSKEHVYLRIGLFAAPLLCFWEAIYMRLHWLHFFGCILLLVQIYIFPIVNQKLIIGAEGVQVKRLFQRAIKIRWSEIRYTGDFSMIHLGSRSPSQVYFFSKKPVYPYEFIRSHTLPKITEDFVFVLNQPKINESVQFYISGSR